MLNDPDVMPWLIMISVGGFLIYFLPWLIALSRGHLNTTAIFFTNLLLGWIVIGWIVAFIWAFSCNTRRESERRR